MNYKKKKEYNGKFEQLLMFFEDILRTLVTGESPCYTDRVKIYRARSVDQGDFSVERIMSEKKMRPAALMPRYSYSAVIFAFLFNTLVYTGSRWIAGEWPHHNIETPADRMIPFLRRQRQSIWDVIFSGRSIIS